VIWCAREDARLDRMRDRQRLSKFCLRHGRLLPTSAWTVIRRKWLGEQRFEHAAEQITFDTYLHAVDLVDRRIEMLERAIRETAEQGPWRELVARLRCLRGIDTLTALALVAEIGDFVRFHAAEEFMAFVGLVPSEQSSGERPDRSDTPVNPIALLGSLGLQPSTLIRRRRSLGRSRRKLQRGQGHLELIACLGRALYGPLRVASSQVVDNERGAHSPRRRCGFGRSRPEQHSTGAPTCFAPVGRPTTTPQPR
jgi:hypothetical protein